MGNRSRLGILVLAVAATPACSSSHPPDASPDAGEPGCEDQDGDGFGEGSACEGPDCDDVDADRHDACGRCVVGSSEGCYDGPAATDQVGTCARGRHECLAGEWGPCVGAVLPTDEVCDGADQDCDGEVDDGVTSTCGNCDPGCHLVCAGVDCAVPFEPGVGAVRAVDGSIGPEVGGGDVTRHVIWLPGGSDGIVYRVDTGTLDVLGAYAFETCAMPWGIVADTWGNAFVGRSCNGHDSVFRIDADECGDANGDGVLTTSTRADDVLPDGGDDCVRWRAALDVQYFGNMALAPDGRLWVALWDEALAPLDAETGEPAGDPLETSISADGILAVADGLWIATATTLCHVDPSGPDEECWQHDDQYYAELDLAADGAVLGLFPLARRDPASEELELVLDHVFDLAVDGRGLVWAQPIIDGASHSEVLYRFDDALSTYDTIDLATSSRHIAADADGQIWTVAARPGVAAVYDAETGEHRGTLFDECPDGCLDALELGNDPAGARFRRAFPDVFERAQAGVVLEASCDPGQRRSWTGLNWQATADSPILLEARAAPDRERLAIAPWTAVARTPPAAGSLALGLLFDPEDTVVEVRARFRSEAARLERIDLGWRCDP